MSTRSILLLSLFVSLGITTNATAEDLVLLFVDDSTCPGESDAGEVASAELVFDNPTGDWAVTLKAVPGGTPFNGYLRFNLVLLNTDKGTMVSIFLGPMTISPPSDELTYSGTVSTPTQHLGSWEAGDTVTTFGAGFKSGLIDLDNNSRDWLCTSSTIEAAGLPLSWEHELLSGQHEALSGEHTALSVEHQGLSGEHEWMREAIETTREEVMESIGEVLEAQQEADLEELIGLMEDVLETVGVSLRPNLRPVSLAPPVTVPPAVWCNSPTGSLELTITVENVGSLPAEESVTRISYAMLGGEEEDHFVNFPSLAPGDVVSLSTVMPVGCFFPGGEGSCSFTIVVDDPDDIEETVESDNVAVGSCSPIA